MCSSRNRKASAPSRPLATRELITTPTVNSAKKVIRYSVSEVRSEKRGGTKKKSKAKTPSEAARMAGFSPRRTAASTTASR